MAFNQKYGERGSLFQGGYHARAVNDDRQFRYLTFYVLVKNALECYPGGITQALAHFPDAWQWLQQHPYSSSKSLFAETEDKVIIDDPSGLILAATETPDSFMRAAHELLILRQDANEYDKNTLLESW